MLVKKALIFSHLFLHFSSSMGVTLSLINLQPSVVLGIIYIYDAFYIQLEVFTSFPLFSNTVWRFQFIKLKLKEYRTINIAKVLIASTLFCVFNSVSFVTLTQSKPFPFWCCLLLLHVRSFVQSKIFLHSFLIQFIIKFYICSL